MVSCHDVDHVLRVGPPAWSRTSPHLGLVVLRQCIQVHRAPRTAELAMQVHVAIPALGGLATRGRSRHHVVQRQWRLAVDHPSTPGPPSSSSRTRSPPPNPGSFSGACAGAPTRHGHACRPDRTRSVTSAGAEAARADCAPASPVFALQRVESAPPAARRGRCRRRGQRCPGGTTGDRLLRLDDPGRLGLVRRQGYGVRCHPRPPPSSLFPRSPIRRTRLS